MEEEYQQYCSSRRSSLSAAEGQTKTAAGRYTALQQQVSYLQLYWIVCNSNDGHSGNTVPKQVMANVKSPRCRISRNSSVASAGGRHTRQRTVMFRDVGSPICRTSISPQHWLRSVNGLASEISAQGRKFYARVPTRNHVLSGTPDEAMT